MTATAGPVVAGVDGSEHSLAAARQAAAAAGRRGLELRLVHGYLHPFGYGSAPLQPYPIELPEPSADAERMLEGVAAKLREAYPGLVSTTRQVLGGAAGALVAESEHAELIFVGSRGLGGFSGLLLGSVSAQVAAHARCPVVVVRPPEPAADAPVLVGVDGSDGARQALEFGFTEAAVRRSPLVAMHVYWTRSADSVQRPGGYVDPAAREAAERLLAGQLAEPAGRHPGVPVQRRLVHSPNSQYSLIEASREAGLVAVGSRGRGGFSGLLLGSVSQALVHHSHCPVAVVRRREPGSSA